MKKSISKSVFFTFIFIGFLGLFICFGSETAKADVVKKSSFNTTQLSSTLSSGRVITVPESQAEKLKMSRGKTVGLSIVEYAYQFLGRPYVWGAEGPSSFDCSGFTMYVYRQFGYYLPHYTGYQWQKGTAVSRSELQIGDLVFFNTTGSYSHVGIYIGNSNFIHASSGSYQVKISSLNESYYNSRFCGGRRII
ncbi:C40 family peptidase [Clostridium sp. DL1XJH146]